MISSKWSRFWLQEIYYCSAFEARSIVGQFDTGQFDTGQFDTGQFGTGQFGTKIIKWTIWHQDNKSGQFGTRTIWPQDNLAPDNLAPGQFGTKHLI